MTQSTVKVLGIHFSYDKKLADKKNFCKQVINGHALLKVQMKCFFYSRIWKNSKNQEDCRLPFLNIFSSSRVIKV